MDFVRLGMQGAQPRFQKNGIMENASDLSTFEVCEAVGYESAKKDRSCYRYDIDGIDHPDARLIAAAPDLLAALTMVRDADEDCEKDGLQRIPVVARHRIDMAIAKATGEEIA